MKRFTLVSFLLLAVILLTPSWIDQNWVTKVTAQSSTTTHRITNFNSQIEIEQDTDLHITETITYKTDQPRHGIYRTIPLEKKDADGQTERFTITNITVHDPDGQPYPWEKSLTGANLLLKIGDPEKTFTGEKIYVVSYTTKHAVDHYETYDELYWDIIGEGGNTPIEKVEASVTSPWAKIEEGRCYTGQFGSTTQDCQLTKEDAQQYQAVSTTSLSTDGNFTLLLKLNPDNQLEFPGLVDNILMWLRRYGLVVALFIAPSIMVGLWWSRGRDWITSAPHVLLDQSAYTSKRRLWWPWQSTPYVYEPFENLTPAQVGAVVNEKIEIREIIGEIIDLARQKVLSIERKSKKKFLITEEDYIFTKKSSSSKKLPVHQQYLLEKMFGDKQKVKLSELKGSFYKYLPDVKNKIWDSVVSKDFFTNNPRKTRKIYLAISILLSALTIALSIFIVSIIYFAIPWPILLAVLISGFMLWLSQHLPAKTKEGTSLMLQAEGLKKTIKRGAWREAIKEKHLFIEEVLPFAVGMGVAKQLAKDMEKIGETPPEYITGALVAGRGFDNFEDSFVSRVSQGISYNPNTGGSSSSGFSSGGGSSGGGGGGGSVGGW